MFQNCNAVERNTKAEKYRGKRKKCDSRESTENCASREANEKQKRNGREANEKT
jgi:hypothetical protein